jgi:hypothetical protein
MRGARVGRRLFPGSWSWKEGKTAGLVMQRKGGATRLPIEQVKGARLEYFARQGFRNRNSSLARMALR